MELAERIREKVRDVKDWPKPGIVFKDLSDVTADGTLFGDIGVFLASDWEPYGKVAGIEARGLSFGSLAASCAGAGFVPVRKRGKLPGRIVKAEYALEYGVDVIEMHPHVIEGEDVLIVDDVLATGGTAEAAARLVEKAGGRVVGFAFALEIGALKGRERLRPLGKVRSACVV